jgi:hypothetical protein
VYNIQNYTAGPASIGARAVMDVPLFPIKDIIMNSIERPVKNVLIVCSIITIAFIIFLFLYLKPAENIQSQKEPNIKTEELKTQKKSEQIINNNNSYPLKKPLTTEQREQRKSAVISIVAVAPIFTAAGLYIWARLRIDNSKKRHHEAEDLMRQQEIIKRNQEIDLWISFDESRRNDPQYKNIILNLRGILAHIEFGLDLPSFRQQVLSAWIGAHDFLNASEDSPPKIASNYAFIYLREAINILERLPTQKMQIIGGGFGVEGALTGMAIATGINAIIDGYVSSKCQNQIAKANDLLTKAVQEINILTKLLAKSQP